MGDSRFTPALGRPQLTFLYDAAVGLLTRERRWRSLLLRQLRLQPGERILDVGCGTGTFAVMMKAAEPRVEVVGVDPDEQVLGLARQKALRAGVQIRFVPGYARDAGCLGRFDKAVASLVFHQVPVEEKERGIRAMFEAVGPAGEVHIADYARQNSFAMRQLFRIVQALDGYEDTQANVDGALETILADVTGDPIEAEAVVRTATGAISLFRAELCPGLLEQG